jgi:nitronate monooxygenase
MGIQVSGVAGARRAVDAGADYLICQGTEAGGHVQGTRALYEVLPAVIDEAKTVPVLAAGGIANGAHIRRALLAGASGVLIGTRFVATKEAGAHGDYKGAITQAKAADTVLNVCFQNEWANAPHRTLRNRTLEMWEAAGCPPPGKRPGEGDILATNSVTGATRRRYSIFAPQPDDRGTPLEMVLFAGQGVDAIRDIPSAGELVARLWKECLDAK